VLVSISDLMILGQEVQRFEDVNNLLWLPPMVQELSSLLRM